MATSFPVLTGNHIRLEPLEPHHAPALAGISAAEPSLYQWSQVPQGLAAGRAALEPHCPLPSRASPTAP